MSETTPAAHAAGVAARPALTISRTFHAQPPAVFAAWTSADHVRQWFSPETYTVSQATVEAKVGGAFDVCMLSPTGEEHWMRGVFVEIEPATRLVIEAQVSDPGGPLLFSVRTEVTFVRAMGGTQMDVRQTYDLVDPAAAAPMVAGAAEGWRTTLDKLTAELLRMIGSEESANRSVVHAIFCLERTYEAPAARVWKALTDPQAKQMWFGAPEDRTKVLERSMDVRPGGRERLMVSWDGGVITTFDAIYHDVVPLERLVYGYEMHMGDRKISVSLATMELKAAAGGCTLRVTEQGAFLDGYDDAGSREHGTGHLLDRLGAALRD
jgi:uncharacterized protein YndB with AHSA1/START domain